MINRLSFYFLSISIGCCLWTCKPQNPVPSLPEDKLIRVLTDLHFAEAAMTNIFGGVKDSLARTYYQQIYSIHGIDSIILQEQLTALRKNPEYMNMIYDKVVTGIEEKEVAIKKKR